MFLRAVALLSSSALKNMEVNKMRKFNLIACCVAALALAGCATTKSVGPTEHTGSKPRKAAKITAAVEATPVAEAQKWVGTLAKRDRNELKVLMTNNAQVGYTVDPLRTPWCAGFANAMLVSTGYQGTGSLLARSFLNYGVTTHSPNEGDIVVLRRGHNGYSGHVGFFVGYEYYRGQQYVRVLGGNTRRSVDVGHYPASRVLGYRKPVEKNT
jgi:uncharacterized protein (TIGR02594 family)